MQLSTISRALQGIAIKSYLRICFWLKKSPGELSKDSDLVISLTSYGRRVRKSVPYTIYYLFKQTIKPRRIVLWLDYDNWNKDNIPSKLKFLEKYGLEIRFCKDIKSYKKLIYTLKLYPNNKIITVDDDSLYYKDVVKTLSNLSEQYPNAVISLRSHQLAWDEQSQSSPSYRCGNVTNDKKKLPRLPTGAGGILYPPGCFNDEVFNEKAFTTLCPTADDIWFWAMEIYNKCQVVGFKRDSTYPIESFYQYFHKGSALEQLNVDNNANDKQIKAVFDYYKLGELL